VDIKIYSHSVLLENSRWTNSCIWVVLIIIMWFGHPHTHTTIRSIIHREQLCHNVLLYQHHACSYFGHKVSCEHLHRSPSVGMTSNRSSAQNRSVTCSHKVNRNIFMSTESFPILAIEVTWVKLRDDPIVWLYRFQIWQHSSSISTNMKKRKSNHKEQKKQNKK